MQSFAGLCKTPRDFERLRTQCLAGLANLGRHNITGALCTAGLQHQDWSSAYRALQRVPVEKIFAQVQKLTLAHVPTDQPWVVGMDDSILRKTGRRIPGCGWRRDPLSPPFHVNFTWGQRVLQLSAALPSSDGAARLVPVDFRHAPLPAKPGRKATAQQQQAYKEALKQANLNRLARDCVAQLRAREPARALHLVVDGRFTNRTLLHSLPQQTVLIGRIRKDTVVHFLPQIRAGRGRPRRYGTIAPTPQALLHDPAQPFETVSAWACDRRHDFKIKTLGPVRLPICGVDQDVRIVVIAPLGYRLRQGGKLFYRQPSFLLCTQANLPVQTILQEYLWRWDIEVNFRDEKTLLGVSEAQLRNPAAVDNHPSCAVAAYSLLLLAAQSFERSPIRAFPLPKWRRHQPPPRLSTSHLVSRLRCDLWAHCLRQPILDHFSSRSPSDQNPPKINSSLASAVFHARN